MLSKLSRRELIRAGGVGAAVFATWVSLPLAIAANSVPEALEELLAGRRAIESTRIRLDLPPHFEYGNTVPLAFTVDSLMTASEYVRSVRVFADGNPFPEVATFHFTPRSGRARTATRIRLNAGNQRVTVVAELSDGSALIGGAPVEISLGGCNAEAGVDANYVIPTPEPRLKAPEHTQRGTIVEIKTMISHLMETGLRSDKEGKPIPRRIVNRFECRHAGEEVFAVDLTPAIAANAYLGFDLVATKSGVLECVWREDGGAVYAAERRLMVT